MTEKSPISILQELMQQKSLVPHYDIQSVGSLLAPRFLCIIKCNGIEGEGSAKTKKESKHLAASDALFKMGYKKFGTSSPVLPNPNSNTIKSTSLNANFVGQLCEYCSCKGLSYPDFIYSIDLKSGQYICICQFFQYETEGYGANKKAAKQIASKYMLEKLKGCNLETLSGLGVERLQSVKKSLVIDDEEIDNITKMYKSLTTSFTSDIPVTLNGPVLKNDIEFFDQISSEEIEAELRRNAVNYNLSVFQNQPCIIMFKVTESNITLMGHGATKNEAKKNVLMDALQILKEGCAQLD